ncbi:UbiA family prenyltransferase [Flavihumibacter sp. RY-1]|uniref:UbiA family prenyltransferase n=1 Tax=Flavihumibacter fluminis TaxID=2909236 RepID=A0ABS9BKK2_9BACT|nr:UbiA family prenyltransferase [Flavihumibacter fluminis]MCF1716087.1 UbiA family prenyltransferase [Flavihumibacter fluminis]
MIIKSSTIQLLRFPFSFFLLPVYLFGISQPLDINWIRAALLFFILHFLVYPSSNGYNSYMDRDQSPIGGLEHPPPPERELWTITLVMDLIAVGLSLLLSYPAAMAVAFYILASRAYSSRKIRLKKFAFFGFLVVISCQGGLIFWLSYHASHAKLSLNVPITGMLVSTLLLAGAYPLTQIYQHRQDAIDGVTTISMRMGIRGTFRLSGLLFMLAFLVLGLHFGLQLELDRFLLLLLFFLPVSVYFLWWGIQVWKNPAKADFRHLMKMNIISAICSTAAFGSLLIWK